MRTSRTAIGAGLFIVEAGLAVVGVLIHYVLTAEYGDVTGSALEAMTSGFVGVPLLVVGAAGVAAALVSTRPSARWAAVALPVLMVVGMLVVTPAALASKLQTQYDATPQCGAYEGMGPAGEEVSQAQRAFDSIEHVGDFTGGGGEGSGGCFRTFVLTQDVDVLQHYRSALPRGGWRVVGDDGQRLRAEREGMAFEVAVCDVAGMGDGGGVVWAGRVTDQSEARCGRI